MPVTVYLCEWRPALGETYPRLIRNHDLMEAESIEELPQWIQERIAVLRLLDKRERTPLGGWTTLENTPAREDDVQFVVAIVPQPGDPVQLKEQGND